MAHAGRWWRDAEDQGSARPSTLVRGDATLLLNRCGTPLGVNFATVENTEFKYICDVNPERGEPLMRKLEEIRGKLPQRFIDMRQVFDDKDVDAVVIATPEHWHALATV